MQIISTTVPTARHQAYCAWSLQISKKEFDVFISFFLNVEHMERIHRRLRTYGGTAFSLSAHSRFFFLPCSILTGWAAFTRSLYSYPLRFWYAALTTPSDFISLMDSISRWPATQQHTGSVSVETHAPQPRQTASTAETLLHSPLRNFSFSSHMHTHTHTFGQVDGGGWASWKAGIMCLTGSLSDLSVPAEKQPGGRQLLTKMTNVHWAFPIPLLSVRTNASYCACVCVCKMTECHRGIK